MTFLRIKSRFPYHTLSLVLIICNKYKKVKLLTCVPIYQGKKPWWTPFTVAQSSLLPSTHRSGRGRRKCISGEPKCFYLLQRKWIIISPSSFARRSSNSLLFLRQSRREREPREGRYEEVAEGPFSQVPPPLEIITITTTYAHSIYSSIWDKCFLYTTWFNQPIIW